jgi:small subunit ribosomal protein S20
MATIRTTKRQARKRQRQALERRDRNRAVRTRVRRQLRTMRAALADGNQEQIKALLPETVSIIDVGWRKGVLHRNTAARYKSRMAAQAHAVLSKEA